MCARKQNRSPSPPCIRSGSPPLPRISAPSAKAGSTASSKSKSISHKRPSSKHVSFAPAPTKYTASSTTPSSTSSKPAAMPQTSVHQTTQATYIQQPQFTMTQETSSGNGHFRVQGGYRINNGDNMKWHSYEASMSSQDFLNAAPSLQAGFVNAMIGHQPDHLASILNSGHPAVNSRITDIQNDHNRSGSAHHSRNSQREPWTLAPMTNANLHEGTSPSVYMHNISTESNAMTSISRRSHHHSSGSGSGNGNKKSKKKCSRCGVREKTGVDIREIDSKTHVCWGCVSKDGPGSAVNDWLVGVK